MLKQMLATKNQWKWLTLFWFFCLALIVVQIISQYSNRLLGVPRVAAAWLAGNVGIHEQQMCVYALDYATHPVTGDWVWTLGALPVLLMMPLVAIDTAWHTLGISPRELLLVLHMLVIAVICTQLYLLGKKFFSQRVDAMLFAGVALFATPLSFIIAIPRDHHLYHLVGFALALAFVLEYLGRKRFWLLGMYTALLIHVRFTAALIVLWPVCEITVRYIQEWRAKQQPRIQTIAWLYIQMLVPIAVGVSIALLLNQWRFANLFETGYAIANIMDPQLLAERARYGVMSIRNIPYNLYWYFFALPTVNIQDLQVMPSTRGVSIFLISIPLYPVFHHVFRGRAPSARVMSLWCAIFTIFVLLLLFYSAGAVQQGLRYTVDFLPLLLVLYGLAFRYKAIPVQHLFWMILGSIINGMLLLHFV